MKALKEQIWTLRKKMIRQARVLRSVPRATGLVGLSEEGAKAAYGTRDDVILHTFSRENRREIIPPQCLPDDETFPQVVSLFPDHFPDYEAVLLDVCNPNFTFQHHHVLDDENRVIYEPQMRFEQLPITDKFLVECKKLKGTIAYLGNTMFCQYAHWLQRQLSMLPAYWELFGKENIDYYYIGDGDIKKFAEESLLQLGVRKEQMVSFPCRGDRSLICVKSTATDSRLSSLISMRMDDVTYRFLKENLFQPGDPVAGKRLFVQRGEVSGRRELNLPEVKEALEPLGFEFVTTQGMTMQQEADLFGNADVIVAVHGAALHNLLFARPGTKVVEIFPYDYFEESNYVIANYGGCDYFYLIGAPLAGAKPGHSLLERNRADVMIDIEKLNRLSSKAGVL